jgi:hypothetical protein
LYSFSLNTVTKLKPSIPRARPSTLVFFFLLYVVSIASYTPSVALQYFSELLFISYALFSSFHKRLHKSYFFPLFFVILVSLICFPLQALVASLNSFRLLLILTLSFFFAISGRFDRNDLLSTVDLFFLLDILATIFVPSSVLSAFTSNPDLIDSGAGGLFFNFHLNGYLLGLWLFYHTLYRPMIFFPSVFLLLYTSSKQSIVFYVVSFLLYLVFRALSKLSKFRSLTYSRSLFYLYPLAFALSLVSLLVIVPAVILSSIDPSMDIIYNQFLQMGGLSLPLLPSDIYAFSDIYFSYEGGLSIANEISLFDFIFRYGLIGTLVLFSTFSYAFPALLPFIILPLFHYSFLYAPLTFLLMRRVHLALKTNLL